VSYPPKEDPPSEEAGIGPACPAYRQAGGRQGIVSGVGIAQYHKWVLGAPNPFVWFGANPHLKNFVLKENFLIFRFCIVLCPPSLPTAEFCASETSAPFKF
jgi:hypothetical protein